MKSDITLLNIDFIDAMNLTRCTWALSHSLEEKYHDEEWGVPTYDDRTLFEFLSLEGAQAGLSWLTILQKRDAYREAFANFEVEKVAKFTQQELDQILAESSIVRNKLKVKSVVTNAHCFIEVQNEFGSFSKYIWSFVGGTPIINAWEKHEQIPATSKESEEMSKALKKRGFKFVGPTICYAYMQAVGMVNDHLTSCFRYQQVME